MNEEHKPRQRFLALDTSTAVLAAAVMSEESLVAESNTRADRNHAVHVVQALKDLMENNQITKEDIAGIAVGIGPGSYTGVRIAVTAAKTLAWAWDVPVTAVSSLAALAMGGLSSYVSDKEPAVGQARSVEDNGNRYWVVPLMDARRGQAYTALFEGDGPNSALHRMEPDAIRLVDGWVDAIASLLSELDSSSAPSGILFVGDVEPHRQTLEKLQTMQPEVEVHLLSYEMEGRYVGKLGAARLLQGEQNDVHTLLPNYTQLAEAEANLLRK
ncbi:tRNA (adenosine(37)-N6)-threonylcarbamoyltransferase complex dimerization subunit type 1 TsaB [Paenibacillus sp. Marseille-Q4541]|uniref:tRNA (adenosine(37)-N6)-threonylcarbamoyltransferase complex dimerization subunit type 1 TsaB n=1 Tax=Paenibacillus sp. Marseille-Q4541 TaxID=2831522 RepID=UPI001BAC39E5|nr:tRNA (adenosine(37)-N6)-threonylcarbamoyltransferase complex dimerization subunit type 1 TsaB [Paenibacillus sp. Marseille-Q4541]